MIQIKPNNYVQPTEVREEVVQAICEAFLGSGMNSHFHPRDNRVPGSATLYVYKPTRDGLQKVWGFKNKRCLDKTDISYRIRGCEMKRAFEELRKAGYFMFYSVMYGEWEGYICHTKPHLERRNENPRLVESFNDFID